MNPVFPVAKADKTDLTAQNPAATPLRPPQRASQPSPALSSAQARSTKPALLSLKLNLPKSSGDADGHPAGPSSPSSRSKAKVQRAITEAGGQKRAIDGFDGPGITETKPGKRQKTSTPPGSPRSNTSPLKQLVRQSRPVTDLKAMAGLSPRRADTASPPSSPRMAASDDGDNGGVGLDTGTVNSLNRSVLMESGRLAPRWRSTSDSGLFEGLLQPSNAVPAQSAGVGAEPLAKSSLADGTKPANPATRDALPAAPHAGISPDENQLDFTFSECGYGENGELQVLQQGLPPTENRLAMSGTASPESQSVTSTMILAEFLPKARAQKIAAASYIAGLSCQAAETADTSTDNAGKGRRALAELLKQQQAGLETDDILVELALGQHVTADMTAYLNTTAATLARMKMSLAELAALDRDGSAGTETVATRQALSASLDAMEVACKFGVELLADNNAPISGNAAGATQAAQRADPVITPSNATLIAELESLDALMDAPILPATRPTAASVPKKQ
jgi:hypothetical protein